MPDFLIMKDITKKFGNVLANDCINLSLGKGEIHGLLGENGAGKTTLMNILYGLYRPDKGQIYFKGKEVNFKSPYDSIKLGIGMVHQHFKLVKTFTVGENIALGEKGLFLSSNIKNIKNKLKSFEELGFKIDPEAYIWQLSVGEQQKVEIIKALYHGAELLILDEPTAVLTPDETEEFFTAIKLLKKQGNSIIFITHKLKEVMNITDKITVLRDGKKADTINTGETDEQKLAFMMVGRELTSNIPKSAFNRSNREIILEITNLTARNNKNLTALDNVSFTVHKGEIYGIAGVEGNGQKELAEVITGLRKAIEGNIIINNTDIKNYSPEKIIKKKIAHIPEDRRKTGAIINFNLMENSILGITGFMDKIILNHNHAREFTENIIKDYHIKTSGISSPCSSLSGGNLQKLITGRELSKNPSVIVAVNPTRGLDPGATEYLHKIFEVYKNKGMGIILISADLNEILRLSDTIGVIYKGKITGEFTGEEACVKKIGLLMAGIT